jgi:hypothetical protein
MAEPALSELYGDPGARLFALGDPSPVFDHLVVFGPAARDIDE